jgi:UDP-N-acetylmuramoyl-tripeptide--D-alanyl-D-alanine ligase
MKSFFKKMAVALLTWEANAVIQRHKPSVVAVTGSVGKTSTKDAIHAMLCGSNRVRKSEKSFTSEISVPLTILGRSNAVNPIGWLQNIFDGLLLIYFRVRYPDWLILELGADRPGDIRTIASWLPIDIGVIVRIPDVPVHVEYFASPEEVAEEKAALIAGLKASGTLILNADDARVMALRNRAGTRRVMTFGFSPEANVRAGTVQMLTQERGSVQGMKAEIYFRNDKAELSVQGAVGAHVFVPLLAAIAVGVSLDKPLESCVGALQQQYEPPPGRMRLVAGHHGALIIDDSYNASPTAVQEALRTLAAVPAKGHKYAVLGDMMELGKFSVEEHRKAGVLAAKCLLSRKREPHKLITVGIRARDMAAAALEAGMPERSVLQFEEAEEAGAWLAQHIGKGDVVLVKGSQVMRLERVIKLIMAEPQRAEELLVRQGMVWNKK